MLKNFYPLVLASLGLSLASLPANPEVKADTPAAPETEAPSPVAPTTATSSEALTSQAWDAYNLRDYPTATSRAELCRKLYQAQAKEMQAKLTELPSGDAIKELWALNDVGTCTLILGMAAEGAGKNDQAEKYFTEVIKDYSFAQCWDSNGWYWQPSAAAQEKLDALKFNAME